MLDDVRIVTFDDKGYATATTEVFAALMLAEERDGSLQNGFSALLMNLAMLVEREPGADTNKALREKCELIGRTLLQQVKMLREQHDRTGQRMFDQLADQFDRQRPSPSIQ